jgi:CTP:molybdopterin cytidylyltransferase MocA
MAHSLRLANAAIDASDTLLVLLADMPYITRASADVVLAFSASADICYPIRGEIGGHPVRFSPHARTKIAALPDGDSLRTLRDDPTLTRATLPLEDDVHYRDIDTPADLP